jgi:hypothetical protein
LKQIAAKEFVSENLNTQFGRLLSVFQKELIMRSTFYAVMLFTLLLGCSITGFAASPVRDEFKVTEVFLKADDGRPTGPCPLRVVFSGYITANGPGAIKYTFTRSDGATGPVYIMEFKKAGTQPVMTDWTLGDSRVLPRYAGWQAVKVLSPVEIESNHDTGSFEINCCGTTEQFWRSSAPIKLKPNQIARLVLTNTGNESFVVRLQFVDKNDHVLTGRDERIAAGGSLELTLTDPFAVAVDKRKSASLPPYALIRAQFAAASLLLIRPTLRIIDKESGDTIRSIEASGFTKAALGPPVVQP